VLLTHRASPERAHAVADAIAARGGRALVCQADLATREACEALVAEAREGSAGSTSGSTTPARTC
jgi:NAD(P)-dependent dehydrogenase (short-subunit alcohol dehydrogenase family)